MKKIIIFTLAGFILLTPFSQVEAAVSPVAISIIPPVQFPSKDFTITGARLSLLWGSHRDVYGLDLGVLGNYTAQDFTGIALSGLINKTDGTTHAIGLQAAGISNWNSNKTSIYGLQLAAVLNKNIATSTVVGFQVALINLSEQTAVYGAQLGVYNRARVVYGFQIGLVNDTTNLHGIQIGLVNFNRQGLFVVSPIINMGF